ncbi:MAG: aminotransferase class IV [Alistipes sp.]|nr:aminotransferase class IV [Alistipes sp.]
MGHSEEYIIRNGELQSLQPASQVYVYQDIHTLSHTPRHAAQHLRIIDHAAQKLFGINCKLSIKELENTILRLLDSTYTTHNTSACVRLRLYASGECSLQLREVSIYRGYALRSLRYEATFVAVNAPLGNYPTSAIVATRDLLQQMAQARDLHFLIMTTPDAHIISECCEPLMMIKNRVLYVPSFTMPSAEQQLMERIAVRLGLKVAHENITVQQLKDADEVFILSWQGITAMGHINQRTYMSTLAERLAAEMEKQFT